MALINSDVVPFTGGAYELEQSLRFNDDDSAYLSWTPSSAGNRKTWTWSGWVKRGNLGEQTLFSAGGSGTEVPFIRFSSDKLEFYCYQSSTNKFVRTTSVYRDVSSWYHILVAVDLTESTASNRVKLYVNGEQVTTLDSTSYPDQNVDLPINNTVEHRIGSWVPFPSNVYLDAYLSEVHFIDGQQLDSSYFGETGDYGEWKPIEYTGTYGTNGFYLDFDGTYYNDKSGNGNNFTANNLATTDVVLDSPTNNFATLNAINKASNTLSEGNLKTTYSSNNVGNRSTFGMSSGKWYFEFLTPTCPNYTENGIVREDLSLTAELTSGSNQSIIYLNNDGAVWNGGSQIVTGLATWGSTDIIGVAVDIDNDTIKFYKNNTLQTTVTSVTLSGYTWFVASGQATSSTTVVIHNYGQDSSFAGNKTAQGNTDDNSIGDFYYTPPSGYLALCTANLADPAVIPSENFNTVLYTGNGSTQSITGVGFQPDFTWIKERDSTNWHCLYDVVRGVTKNLFSNDTYQETTDAQTLQSFDSDGFTNGNSGNINESTKPYVSWNWKANGSGSSNTNGSITSTVSANQDTGFSIVSYTGDGTNYASGGATIGHGLTAKPQMIIVKERSGASGWVVYTETTDATDYLQLDGTSATADYHEIWADTEPTSSVFTVGGAGNVNTNGDTYIAYCFHSVDGFSKVGSYTGNGSTDGTFVYTGFRPAYVMIKATDYSGTSWFVHDKERLGYNPNNSRISAGETGVEVNDERIDLLSNGFKLITTNGNWNASGYTYIYIAFAENPFKYTNAR